MKFQKCGVAAVLILGVSLLFFSIYGCQAGQVTSDEPLPRALLDQMKSYTAVPDKAKGSLSHQIASDFEAMKVLFETKDFKSLAMLLGRRGVYLATESFEKIPGAGSAKYWESVWEEGVELKLVPVYIYLAGVKEPLQVPFNAVIDEGITIEEWRRNPSSYDTMAILVFECHIVKKAMGKPAQNRTDLGTAIYFHKNICPWG